MATIVKTKTKAGEQRWVVRYRAASGRAVEEWKSSFADADARRKQVEADEHGGVVIDPRAGRITVGDYFDRWLEERLVKGRPLTPSTRIGYRRLYTRNIADALGPKAIRSLRPDTVRSWRAELAARSGRDQAAKSYRLLRAVLATAEADELIRLNPCRIRGGGQEHADERPLVPTSLVLDLADAIGERYRSLVLVVGFGGLRTGECLGLERRDIDLLHGEVRVEKQAQEIAGSGRVVVPPKSDAGRRVVALPRVVVEALDAHLSAFVGPEAGATVFVGPKETPLRRATLSDAWRAAVKATGAPAGLRLHDLRHHAATLTARKPGITTKELMARIGHASPRAALIYQHATSERDREVADFLDDVIEATTRDERAPVVAIAGR